MPTALKSAPVALPVPPWKTSLEAKGRVYGRIKAPFVLTRMGNSAECSLLWLWTRRGRQWVVEQELT
jgi:hypothetical protein